MSAADAFGLVVSLARVRVPRLRPLPRGAALDERSGHRPDPRLRGRPHRARVPARHLHGARLHDRAFATGGWLRWLGATERGFYRLVGTDRRKEQDWKGYAKTAIVFTVLFFGLALRDPAPAGAPLPEPGQPAGRAVAHRAEHDRQLHHQHELAVLRRRVHDVVPDPDGRARGAAVRLGRGRDGRPRRRHPRALPPELQGARQLLGRPLPLARLHPAAAGAASSPWS